jgi:hypothetical protein
MTLTLEVSPETAKRLEGAKAQGINIETLLCKALEDLPPPQENKAVSPLASLAGKYGGEAWEELRAEIEKNRRLDAEQRQSEE